MSENQMGKIQIHEIAKEVASRMTEAALRNIPVSIGMTAHSSENVTKQATLFFLEQYRNAFNTLTKVQTQEYQQPQQEESISNVFS